MSDAAPHPPVDADPPPASARESGYRMPAEFQPHDAVWLTPPHNQETWPGCFDQACEQFDAFARELARFVTVKTTTRHAIKTNDSWVRDYGPVFVVHHQSPRSPRIPIRGLPREQRRGLLAAHDFTFNGWGGKYGDEYPDDNTVPRHIAALLGIPLWRHAMVLEGGSIEVNGAGTVMTTEQCLLHENRNPHLSRDQIEQQLHDALGTPHVVWLPGGIVGDDTDGHIDDLARFIAPDTIAAIRADESDGEHPDAAILESNWRALEQARDQDGAPFNLVALPVPQPVLYDFPPDRFSSGGRHPVPASYANFLIANHGVIVPTFGQPTDDVALRALDDAMPDHTIVGLRAEYLVVGLGAFHCLSMQQPTPPLPPGEVGAPGSGAG